MNSDFEWILEDCLKRLRGGQALDNCLAVYPDLAEDLRPLLLAVGHVRSAPAPQPRPQSVQAGRERMLAAARSSPARITFVQPVSSGAFSRYTVRIFTILKTLLFGKETYGMKFALRLAIDLVVILMIGSVLTVNTSARSLPGDPLYGVKRTWEEVRLNLTLNDPARQQLQDQFQQLRLEEVRKMIQLGKTGLVEFEGQLESIAADEWVVSSMRVRMLPDAIVEGTPAVGQTVRVQARVQNDGVLTALQVQVQSQVQNPIPYPSPASSHTPISTPAPSRTHRPTHTWEPTHEPAYEPTHIPWPKYEPTQQSWPNDNHQNDNDHNNNHNNDHNNNNDHCNDCDHHDNSGGSSWSGGGREPHHP